MKELPTLEHLQSLRLPLRNINRERRERLTALERLAVLVTEQVGTMGFFFLVAGWTAAWFLWNMLAPQELRFDPFPAFVLWVFVSNALQLLLLPLLMVGQNLQAKHAEARAEADFEVNQKAEREIEAILAHLEYLGRLMQDLRTDFDRKR